MAPKKRRSVGRPRAKPSNGVPAKQAILEAAAGLFARQGFEGTSTREIANAVGIRQPSLFYHFKRKEDILRAIVEGVAVPYNAYLTELGNLDAPPAVKLYKLMCFDFLYLMAEPFGVGQLILLPELRSGDLGAEVAATRGRLISAYRTAIEAGMADGEFVATDIEVATHTVFGMGEAVWSWYRPGPDRPPESAAPLIADLAMRALLARPGRLAQIKSQAAAIDISF